MVRINGLTLSVVFLCLVPLISGGKSPMADDSAKLQDFSARYLVLKSALTTQVREAERLLGGSDLLTQKAHLDQGRELLSINRQAMALAEQISKFDGERQQKGQVEGPYKIHDRVAILGAAAEDMVMTYSSLLTCCYEGSPFYYKRALKHLEVFKITDAKLAEAGRD